MNGIAAGMRRLRGTSVNQVPDVERVSSPPGPASDVRTHSRLIFILESSPSSR